MRPENRAEREAQIAEAAYELLAEKGYGGTSMLAVARLAKASNETLYRWYGDKAGLFTRLIERNAAEVRTLLEEAIAARQAPRQALAALGPKLLELLTSERAIALNRAAASEGGGELGRALTRAGRETVAPLIADLFARAHSAGDIAEASPARAVELYLNLLVGDLQIRRAIGALPQPGEAARRARAERALDQTWRLLAAAETG